MLFTISNWIKYDKEDSTTCKCAPQYELKSFATMATYWVPDLPNIKGFLATFGIPFRYLLMVPHMHDPASIKIC